MLETVDFFFTSHCLPLFILPKEFILQGDAPFD